MPRWLKYTILAVLFLLIASWPLARQLDGGVIEGRITNQSGPLAGASVDARNIMTGAFARTISATDGHYRLEDLRPGRYSLWFTAPNHCSVLVERIAVEPGETVRRDVRLNRSATVESACEPASMSSTE